MDDFPVERISEFIRGVIELLWTAPAGMNGSDVIALLPEKIQLTNYEIEQAHPLLMPRYEHAVRLATFPLMKAGWMVKTNKGRWILTEDGRDACRNFSRPQDLLTEALRLGEIDQYIVPDFHLVLEVIQEKAWENFVKYVQLKNTMELRQVIGYLFEAMNYHVVWIAPPQKKHGQIHLIASADPVGLNEHRILVQVKHTGQLVTMEGVKSFYSVLGNNDFGLLFSTGGFTPDCVSLLNENGYQRINAMDLEKFYEIWIRHYKNLSLDAHNLLPLKKVYVLSPSI